jgi:hypothetical protein
MLFYSCRFQKYILNGLPPASAGGKQPTNYSEQLLKVLLYQVFCKSVEAEGRMTLK